MRQPMEEKVVTVSHVGMGVNMSKVRSLNSALAILDRHVPATLIPFCKQGFS
jgi:hypothetical protein